MIVASVRDDLAAHIRHVDGDNRAHPADLASDVGEFLIPRLPLVGIVARLEEIKDFVFQADRNKTMGAAALADAIVDRFKLEEN
ncbi:hypothetical protein ACQP2Y_21220 [Actinoplanes sp. CA-051413]|uniref:hypothetical protein n=1 Tax=Actinoplanes sp. CA-051413 TaxID=3239899 RepID=UPI003D963D58